MPERKQSGVRVVDAKKLAKLLDLRKTHSHQNMVLLLGARTGALFRSKAFYESLRQFSNRDFNRLSQIEQFGECHTILAKQSFSETDIHIILRESLQEQVVTKTEDCLAEFVKHQYFDEIISTNIDGFLEQALIRAEMKEGHDFEMTIAGHGIFREKSFPCRIIKAFGDFASRNYTISDRRTYLNDHQEWQRFLQTVLAKDILVIGIDPIWDEAILHLIPGNAGSMWFINEQDLTRHSFTSSILQERQTSYLSGREGNFDNFVRTLHEHLYGGVPINQQLVRDLSQQLSDMANQLQTLQDENKTILNEIKKIQDEIGNLSQRWEQ